MKLKKIYLMILAALLLSFCFSATAGPGYILLINGPAYTNATVVVGSNTNQVGVVAATSTNTYNTFVGSSGASSSSYLISGNQINTNLWPSAGINCAGGYPGTLYAPFNNLSVYIRGSIMATNAAGTQTVPFKFIGSVDGTNTIASYLTVNINIAANTTAFSFYTNITTGGLPYVMLSAIENTNATALTNLVIEANGKPGI